MKKQILSILLVIALTLSVIPIASASTSTSTNQNKKGDINGDGYVTIQDALEILKYLAGIESLLDTPAGFNAAREILGGHAVGINSVLEILKFLAEIPSVFDLTEVIPRDFSITLPAGWVEEIDPYWVQYEAYCEKTGSFVEVSVITLVELFEELAEIDRDLNAGDVSGMNLTQIARKLGMSVEQVTGKVYSAISDSFLEEFYPNLMEISSASITIDGKNARRLLIEYKWGFCDDWDFLDDCDCWDCDCWDNMCDCWDDWYNCECWDWEEECDDCANFDGCGDCNGWDDWPDCNCWDCGCWDDWIPCEDCIEYLDCEDCWDDYLDCGCWYYECENDCWPDCDCFDFSCDCWDFDWDWENLINCGECDGCNEPFPEMIIYLILDNTGMFMVMGSGEGAEEVMKTFKFK
jgi:hypothetical protein